MDFELRILLRRALLIAICTLSFALFLIATPRTKTIVWDRIHVTLANSEHGEVLIGGSDWSAQSEWRPINVIAALLGTYNPGPCLLITTDSSDRIALCLTDQVESGNVALLPLSVSEDMDLYASGSSLLARALEYGGGIVEDSSKLELSLLEKSWIVYSSVQRFALKDTTCYGFTAKTMNGREIRLELLASCVTLNGEGYIWGKFSDVERLEAWFSAHK